MFVDTTELKDDAANEIKVYQANQYKLIGYLV